MYTEKEVVVDHSFNYSNIIPTPEGIAFLAHYCEELYTQFNILVNQNMQKNEMYHIPFDKNYLVGNERFSITGFPTLYLSSSIYGCWEETGRGNLEYANVALFKNTQKIKLISLIAPSSKATVQNNNILLT